MTDAVEVRRSRGPFEWALIVGLPIILNAALAGYLLTQIEEGSVPIIGSVDAPAAVTGSPGDEIPESSQPEILTAVEQATGSDQLCEGPWMVPGRVSVWSCRTDDSVTVIYGLGADGIFLLDVTWFGFDESATDLPAWAAAAFESEADARRAAGWVGGNVGSDAETSIGGVRLIVGGAEGARTLWVEGQD